jgi:stage IV sporulation protein B
MSETEIISFEVYKNKRDRHGRRMKIYRYSLYVCLIAAVIFAAGFGLYLLDESVPSVIYTRSGQDTSFSLGVPAKAEIIEASVQGESNIPEGAVTIDLSEEVTIANEGLESYSYQVRLFGLFPIKQMDIRVVEDTELIPVGAPVGIYMETDGVMVVGVGDFKDSAGMECSPSKYILKSGDYIRRVNGKQVYSKKDFTEMVTDSDGENLILTVERNSELINVTVTPVKDQTGVYKLGLWVRDNSQGVGTLTYIDAEGNFGALGHGITDADTEKVLEILDGTLYDTEIVSVKKGVSGSPGEMTGMITYSDAHILGDITENTENGIFGVCNEKALQTFMANEALPIGFKQEIEKGPAQILSTVGDETKYYDVEITDIHMDHDNVNRGIELKVTDTELINTTGGIVQGMSGSPIIQNGKIIGAVTHVFINDPTRGYGIFIENMLEQ